MRTSRKYSNRWFGSYLFQSSFVWHLYLMSESKEIPSHKLGKVNVPEHPACYIQREQKLISGFYYCICSSYISKWSRWFHSVVHCSQQTLSYWCKSGRERAFGHYFLMSPYLITQESISTFRVRKASHDFWSLHSKHDPNKSYPIQTHFKGKV